jgi:dienelactone hydrolase
MKIASASVVALFVGLVVLPCAAETVRFPTATTPPTPLQERLARERGQPISSPAAVQLTGELYRPTGDGPFPAVVGLHGCAGAPSRENAAAAGAAYVALGYALLIVDSFGPRGLTQRCLIEHGVPADRIMDAYGGLLYLAALPFIDPDRIAVVGYSQGADMALEAVKLGGIETQFSRQFRAAIAYYPWCVDSFGTVSVPTVILIGELDDWTPAQNCKEMMTKRSGQGAELHLVVYPGAYHSFNSGRLRGKPEMQYGHRNEYNEAAAQAAWTEELGVLRKAFGR